MRFAFACACLFVFFSARLAPAERPAFSGLGGTCVSSDPKHLCLGLKYIVYRNGQSGPVANQASALTNIRMMNKLWSQCDIGFQLEQFAVVDPSSYGLSFHPANLADMDSIRSAFADSGRLLIVTTGSWDRNGTLGDSPANAWTAMPVTGPYGSVVEAPVATYSMIYSHEMGHYLNLDHVSGSEDLMNPIIYLRSIHLDSSECETARATAESSWSHALRS